VDDGTFAVEVTKRQRTRRRGTPDELLRWIISLRGTWA
jgi:hypothetical protein